MFFRFHRAASFCASVIFLFAAGSSFCKPAQQKTLTFCADPNNLPYSNSKEQGFENKLAQIVASDLQARVVYRWQRMGRGFVREYLNKAVCDVVPGIPARSGQMLTTAPYYRSTYVFVYLANAKDMPASLNDPKLHRMKIGIQAVGEELTPPGDALARRGMQDAIVPYYTTGDNEEAILQAVATRKINMAIVWGPTAGYFARHYQLALCLVPVTPEMDPPGLPFTFAISMGVRKGNVVLRDALNAALTRNAVEIRSLLATYGIPQLALGPEMSSGETLSKKSTQ
ncbi:MAG TPA: quinoprotein dehydrogenase-associated putative ABC transporter substrate-binding protein [Terriglobales bacterium]|nr:quinoprotein dehydrogenase-associated putative ABC transporter substrate-binding protein [Terriglobales bacterium]